MLHYKMTESQKKICFAFDTCLKKGGKLHKTHSELCIVSDLRSILVGLSAALQGLSEDCVQVLVEPDGPILGIQTRQ